MDESKNSLTSQIAFLQKELQKCNDESAVPIDTILQFDADKFKSQLNKFQKKIKKTKHKSTTQQEQLTELYDVVETIKNKL